MSATQRSPTVECKHPECDSHGRKWEFHHGKFCSTECETRHEGRQAIKHLKFDHRRCFTCFQRLKTVNPPKPDFEFTKNGHGWTFGEDSEPTLQYFDQSESQRAAVGYQFPTEHAGKGEKQRADRVITGTICDHCGNTAHTHHDTTLADREAIGRLVSLLLEDDDVTIDPETLHREYRETEDIELAVGRALPDDK